MAVQQRVRRGPVGRLAAAVLAGSIALAALATGAPASAAARRPTALNRGVYSAAGVRQWIFCKGTGSVTVVVIPGLASTASDWSKVSARLSQYTRTCFYDRPGLGNSPARARTAQILNAGGYAQELAALLRAAHEPGPYVVVGHSFGGLIARAFVRQNMPSIAGVLLAESVDPHDATVGQYWSEAGHSIDMAASQRATGGGPDLGSRPLLVLSASKPDRDHLDGQPYGQPESAIKLWIAEQHADKDLSLNSIQVIARSGHVLQQDNPNAVVAAVHSVVVAAESGRDLHCTYNWAKVQGRCFD